MIKYFKVADRILDRRPITFKDRAGHAPRTFTPDSPAYDRNTVWWWIHACDAQGNAVALIDDDGTEYWV